MTVAQVSNMPYDRKLKDTILFGQPVEDVDPDYPVIETTGLRRAGVYM